MRGYLLKEQFSSSLEYGVPGRREANPGAEHFQRTFIPIRKEERCFTAQQLSW